MAIIKSFTSLEQSRKLADILPIESADMAYLWNGTSFCDYPVSNQTIFNRIENIPCWSLAALLGVLPEYTLKNSKFYETVALWCQGISVECDNIVDACYEMILKLNELNLL